LFKTRFINDDNLPLLQEVMGKHEKEVAAFIENIFGTKK
jgi:hypothetical protein